MTISEISTQLRALSEDYSSQRIFLDEYRLKRKDLLDEIDQTLNRQTYDNTSRCAEKHDAEITEKSDDVDNVMPDTTNRTSDASKKNDDTGV